MKTLIGSKLRLLTGIGFLFAILNISNSCSKPEDNMTPVGSSTGSGTGVKGDAGVPGPDEVWIQGMTYSPATITVSAGTTIIWTNKDGVAHSVTSNTGLFDSGTIVSNGTYRLTFPTTGTFQYFCTFHTSMVASVVVR